MMLHSIDTGTPDTGQVATIVMVFAGEYDIAGKQRFRADLERLLEIPNVVLDLTDVSYADSTAMTELIRIHNARKTRGHPTETLVVPGKNLQKVFELLDFSRVFRFVTSLDRAVPMTGEPVAIDYAAPGSALPAFLGG
jgi:anti-sigma B factor antagonist